MGEAISGVDRRAALKCMCCFPLLGRIKLVPVRGKMVKTIMLASIVSQHDGSPVHVAITDSIDPVENEVRMTNRAWHVFDQKAFLDSLVYHPEYKQGIVRGKLPAKVLEFMEENPCVLKKWKQFHMFTSRWETA